MFDSPKQVRVTSAVNDVLSLPSDQQQLLSRATKFISCLVLKVYHLLLKRYYSSHLGRWQIPAPATLRRKGVAGP